MIGDWFMSLWDLFGGGSSSTDVTPKIMAPDGPYSVGAVEHRFVDPVPDPFKTTVQREFMTTIWYPTSVTAGTKKRYLTRSSNESTWSSRLASWLSMSYYVGTGFKRETHAFQNAQPRNDLGLLPVILHYHGMSTNRALDSSIAQQLASHGFVVIDIDATYECSGVEFPPSRYVAGQYPPNPYTDAFMNKTVERRVADCKVVLGNLANLPLGLGAIVDTGRVGMTGHSWGFHTAIKLAHLDPRIKAVVGFDGTPAYEGVPSPVLTEGVNIPVLALSSDEVPETAAKDGTVNHWTWPAFVEAQRTNFPDQWLRAYVFAGTGHYSFTDACMISGNRPSSHCGTRNPHDAMRAVRSYTLRFFQWQFKGVDATEFFDNMQYSWVSRHT